MIIELVSIMVAMFLMASMMVSEQGVIDILMRYVDITSLISILILSLPILARNGLWKNFFMAFKMMNKKFHCSLSDMKRSLDAVEMMQKQILYAGIMVTSVLVIFVLSSVTDMERISVNMAISFIEVLYTAILELLLLPLQLEVKRRIIDYMEEE